MKVITIDFKPEYLTFLDPQFSISNLKKLTNYTSSFDFDDYPEQNLFTKDIFNYYSCKEYRIERKSAW